MELLKKSGVVIVPTVLVMRGGREKGEARASTNAPRYLKCLSRLLAKVKCTLCGIYGFLLDEDLRITHWDEIHFVSIPMVKNNHSTYFLYCPAIIIRCLNCMSG
jgi:hypothetical protein